MTKQVSAIVSDYNGTLSPAGKSPNNSIIPKELELTLSEIANHIPVCILSRNDYRSLKDRVLFASTISCILGIETIVFDETRTGNKCKVKSRRLLIERDLIHSHSYALNQLTHDVKTKFPGIKAVQRFTCDGLLASITFDWRYHKEYKMHYLTIIEYVREKISTMVHDCSSGPFLQTYDSYHFVDVHTTACDKGLGFDQIVAGLDRDYAKGAILYLGDSENDNPAFRKADISIGVYSNRRDSKLDCQYAIDYHHLSQFLRRLRDNDFGFCEELLSQHLS
jgi:hydroxymethylpyrimidine pyrophosphatase-like HAD family hydrolase